MPSFTFVSTANAVVLRGGVPVFVDIRRTRSTSTSARSKTAITPRTRAILPVHYAGVGLRDGRDRHAFARAPRAARGRGRRAGVMASYNGRPLGGIGDLGALSFHETKNVHLRRGRRAARQRRSAGSSGPRSSTRKARTGGRVLPRPGRQVQLGRHRLFVPLERHQRGIPLGPARARGRDPRVAARDLEHLPRRIRRARGRGSCSGARPFRRTARTTRTCTTCFSGSPSIGIGSSSASTRPGFRPCSTMSRCTPPSGAAATVARREICRSPTPRESGSFACRSGRR